MSGRRAGLSVDRHAGRPDTNFDANTRGMKAQEIRALTGVRGVAAIVVTF